MTSNYSACLDFCSDQGSSFINSRARSEGAYMKYVITMRTMNADMDKKMNTLSVIMILAFFKQQLFNNGFYFCVVLL